MSTEAPPIAPPPTPSTSPVAPSPAVEAPAASAQPGPSGATGKPAGADTGKERPGMLPPSTRDERLKRLKDIEAKGRSGSGNAPAAAAPPAEPARAAEPNPQPSAAKEDAQPDKEAKPLPSIKRKYRDDDGKEQEIEVTFDQAYDALIADYGKEGLPAIQKMSQKEVLNLGSKRLLEQRRQDSFGARMAKATRELAELRGRPQGATGAHPPAPTGDAASRGTQGKPNSGEPGASPAQAAQQSPSVSPSPDAAALASQLKMATEQLGFEEDSPVSRFLSGLSTQVVGLTSALQTQKQTYESAMQQQQQQFQDSLAQLTNLHLAEKFASSRKEHKGNWPQLGNDQDFEAVKNRTMTLIRSGEYADPWTAIDQAFVEACHSRFGNQKAETTALQLEAARQKQLSGQPTVSVTRQAESQPQALSRRDRLNKVWQHARETGDMEAGKRMNRTLAAQTG